MCSGGEDYYSVVDFVMICLSGIEIHFAAFHLFWYPGELCDGVIFFSLKVRKNPLVNRPGWSFLLGQLFGNFFHFLFGYSSFVVI